jgi:hypothetical protein
VKGAAFKLLLVVFISAVALKVRANPSNDQVCTTYGTCHSDSDCTLAQARAAAEGDDPATLDSNCSCTWVVFGPNFCGDGYASWYWFSPAVRKPNHEPGVSEPLRIPLHR